MIKILKRRITLMLSIFVSLLLIVVLVFVNIFSNMQARDEEFDLLETSIATLTKGGPQGKQQQQQPQQQYQTIRNMAAIGFRGENATIYFNEEDVDFTEEELYAFAYKIAYSKEKNTKGFKEGRFYVTRKVGGDSVVLISSGEDFIARRDTLRNNTIIFGAIGVLISIWVATLIARWLVKPVAETIDNERAFISDASHELKTPLAVISSNADALEMETGESKWLSCIKSESMRMSTLINEMLTVSRIEKNNDRYTFKKVDFSACVEEAVMNFEAPAFEKGVLINSDIQEGISVHGSEEKLKQVVEILLDNAVKYVNTNGQINVSLKSKITGAVLIVENTGSYIEKEDTKKIFERFYRTDSSRAKEDEPGKPRSYGLGLAIAKRIVEAHEGNISASSAKHTDSDGTETLTTQFKISL